MCWRLRTAAAPSSTAATCSTAISQVHFRIPHPQQLHYPVTIRCARLQSTPGSTSGTATGCADHRFLRCLLLLSGAGTASALVCDTDADVLAKALKAAKQPDCNFVWAQLRDLSDFYDQR